MIERLKVRVMKISVIDAEMLEKCWLRSQQIS